MAVNFLIALATALGSATVILLVLIGALKIITPESFGKTIPRPQQSGLPESLPAHHVIDTATLVALSGEQVLLSGQGREVVVIAGNEIKQKAVMEDILEALSPRAQSTQSVVETLRGKQSAQRVPSEALGLAG